MPLYAYYFCRPDGSAPAFEVHEADTAEHARERAPALLHGHASCAYVTVYEDDRELFTLRRQPSPPVADSSRAYAPVDIAEALSATGLGRTGAAVIATSPDGLVTYWSPRAARLYGWAVQDALGRDILDVTPALQSRAQAESIMERLREGAPWEGEIVLRDKSGTPFSAYVCTLPVGRVAEGDGAIIGLSVAIQDRRTLEGASHALALELGRQMADLEERAQGQAGSVGDPGVAVGVKPT